MIPLLHEFGGETVLVFGGGPVGARKARRFAAEARVLVVSPTFCDRSFTPEERRHPDAGVEFVRAAPDPEAVECYVERASPALVVAATDREAVNAAIGRAAHERGVLVNRADGGGSGGAGSVVVPATIRDDPVLAAVATGGTAPALSRHLRERLEDDVEGAGAMAELVGAIRADLVERAVDPERRRAALRRVVADRRVWKHLGVDGDKARQVAEGVVTDALGDES